MLIPIRTDSRLRSTPWMNWTLIAVNVVIFILSRWFPRPFLAGVLTPVEPDLINFFTYAFLHANFLHLASNMLFLYIFGNNVNDKLGHFGYLGFYLAGGVFAGIGTVVTDAVAVLGASGAVAAVTGAYLVLFPRAHVTVLFVLIFIGTIEVPSMWFIIFFFVQDLLWNFSGLETGVAHMAHISGTVFGFTISLSLLLARLLPRDQFDVLSLLQRWNRRRQYRDIVAKGYDPFSYSEPARETPDHHLQDQIDELRARIGQALARHDYSQAADLFLQLRRIDDRQVLSRQAQLEVASQLASQQHYAQAADAYEQFLAHYRNSEQIEQVELMLGLIYARYLHRYDRAREYLNRALTRLHNPREIQLARAELQHAEQMLASSAPPP